MVTGEDRSVIAFFDVETTIPTRTGQGYALLEFGSILVCPRKLVEKHSYSTLVRPSDLSLISTLSVLCNGITREAVTSAPSFADIADKVFDILHWRIWVGHNILKFDCPRIREAFAGINKPAPEPKGTIDTLALLTERFGRRAGNMKMASLATYFGLGQQTHSYPLHGHAWSVDKISRPSSQSSTRLRSMSLDDVRMNFEVLKYCATVLLLESSLPDILTENSWVSPNAAVRRSRTNGNTTPEGVGSSVDTPSSSVKIETPMISVAEAHIESDNPLSPLVSRNVEVPDILETSSSRPDPFNLVQFSAEVRESIQSDDMEEEPASDSQDSSASTATGGYIGCTNFLEPDNISISSVTLSLSPLYRGVQKIQILHNNAELQVCSRCLKVRFGISTRFVNYAGRPRLSFVVDASSELCQLLDAIDNLAQKLTEDTGSMSEWRPVVNRKPGFMNCPTIRLKFDVAELDSGITPGTILDAYFSVDSYDYQQIAGIRLVARKLIVHSS
ncbi:hypothetical protein RND71_021894 [Anisodus tanguticus]|uniref:Exonuclease domain-containing protein n=1 Tax=Anisodus tanguticus TaxID=243964 RepID=A0AAE1VGJ7_9SOLA|nr:hypothetical protein RND71_021894 [Anisodus tanguticus]